MHENIEYEIMTRKDSLFFGARAETGLTQSAWGSCGYIVDEKRDFLPIMPHTGELIIRSLNHSEVKAGTLLR